MESHAFAGIEDADGSVVIDGKESVRRLGESHHIRSDSLCIRSVVAVLNQLVVRLHAMLQQGVTIPVVTVLPDFHCQRSAVVGDALAAGFDEMCYGSVCTHIVIHHHAAGIHSSTDTVVEYQWHALVDEPLEMVVLGSVLGL